MGLQLGFKWKIKNLLKRGFVRFHKIMIRVFGIYVLPVHYYTPLANVVELEKTKSEWAKASPMSGIDMDLDTQVATLHKICEPYQKEVEGNRIYRKAQQGGFGPGFGYIEAQVLHCVVRHLKPRRIVEVGCGVSTYCMLEAAKINCQETGQDTQVTSIDPYPYNWLKQNQDIHLIEKKVQVTPMNVFEQLEENDFIFLDSSHAVRTGGDVNHMILEVFPRLKPGVVIHIHYINFPYDYPRWTAQCLLRGAEVSLVHAYLMHNHRASVMMCLSHLHYKRPEAIKQIIPEYDRAPDINGLCDTFVPFLDFVSSKHFPSSIYIRTHA